MMRYLAFALFSSLFLLPYGSYADSYYETDSQAQAACLASASPYTCSGASGPYEGYYRHSDGQGGYIYFRYMVYPTGCPAGTEPDPVTGECSVPPDCSETAVEGDVWNSITESCECPSGSSPVLDPTDGYACREDAPECTPDSPNYKGTANGYPVCDWDGFCEAGQSGGFVNGKWVCVNDAACGPGETYINGVCVGPDDVNEDPNPDSNPTPDDTDNDGTPDSEDTDDDNDGTPDVDDSTPKGEGPARSGRASTDCNIPPSCDGDPIDCAILHQSWLNMCNGDGDQMTNEELDSTLSGSGLTDADDLGDNWLGSSRTVDTDGLSVSGALSGLFPSGIVGQVISGGCLALDGFSYRGNHIDINDGPMCTFLQWISIVAYMLTYLAAGTILFNALARSD